MNTHTIFWFSGAGNSKYVAERLDRAFSEKETVRSVSIAEAMKTGQTEYEVVQGDIFGFVFPTYFWGMPSIVEEFIGRLSLKGLTGENKVYLVLTAGGSTGMTDKLTRKALKNRGIHLNACFSVSMPDSYCILLDLMTPTEQIEPMLRDADVRILDIIVALGQFLKQERGAESGELITSWGGKLLIDRGGVPRLKTLLLNPLYNVSRKTKGFHADDRCVSCGKCVQVCPLGIISLGADGKPVWSREKCVHCLACLHNCPVQALQYGNKTQTALRYTFPENHRYGEV